MRKLFIPLGLTITGLIVSLVGLEVAFRIYERIIPPAGSWSDRPDFYFKHEGSETLQDYPYPAAKSPGAFRIAVVGDSYSFAPYMQFTDAFPKKLEQMLNLNLSSSRAEVINYGVPGYSTSHEVDKTALAIEQQADLILLQITLNDPELKPYTPTGIRDFSRFGALKPSPVMEAVFGYWHSLAFVANRLHNTKTVREYTDYFLDLFENPKTFKPWQRSLSRIVELCGERQIKLAAVVFPLFGLPLNDSYPFHRAHQIVQSELNSRNIPYIDLYSLYAGIPLERIQVIPGEDRHPNEIAHRMAAEAIYSWLRDQDLLPEDLIIRHKFKGRTQLIKEEPAE
ncbi:MAG: hypothetical protein DCC75_00205 [Proteobacteria bacterium]|nr:MAG: hypothetical protein DCC75_00205 [Pseudomonadota bacterium]